MLRSASSVPPPMRVAGIQSWNSVQSSTSMASAPRMESRSSSERRDSRMAASRATAPPAATPASTRSPITSSTLASIQSWAACWRTTGSSATPRGRSSASMRSTLPATRAPPSPR